MASQHRYALPPDTRLRHYHFGNLLGHGGFGLTYLARDMKLARDVAIKELFPLEFALREQDAMTVAIRSQDQEINFNWAKTRFLEEARTLAALHHNAILPVYDFFEENGTAYMVTPFIEGDSFEQALRRDGAPAESVLRDYLFDILDALEIVHARQFLHRDIKTENILIQRESGRPILIDFGNARIATGEKTSSVTAVLTPGYAPFEQYSIRGRQGPWTDLYALGAVLYRAINGRPPDDSASRVAEDTMPPISQTQPVGYSKEFLLTIDKALRIRADERWQTCKEWRDALGGRSLTPTTRRHTEPVPLPPRRRNTGRLILGGGVALAISAAGIIAWFHPKPDEPSLNDGKKKEQSGKLNNPDLDLARSKKAAGLPVEAINSFLKASIGGKDPTAAKELGDYLGELASGFPATLKSAVKNDSRQPYGELLSVIDRALAAKLAVVDATGLKAAIEARDHEVGSALQESKALAESSGWKGSLQNLNHILATHSEYASIGDAFRELAGRIAKVKGSLLQPAELHLIIAEFENAEAAGVTGLGYPLEDLLNHICDLALKETDIMVAVSILTTLDSKHSGLQKVKETADAIGTRLALDYDQFIGYNPFRNPGLFIARKKLVTDLLVNAADSLNSAVLKREMARLLPEKAEYWLEKAAAGNDLEAKTRYAALLQPWAAPGKDPAKARALLEEAWIAKNPDAGVALARLEIDGLGGKPANSARAMAILDEVIKSHPTNGNALFLRGRALEVADSLLPTGRSAECVAAYEESAKHMPGLIRIIDFEGVQSDRRRYFDPFLRCGAFELNNSNGKSSELFLQGALNGSTYSGVIACTLFDLNPNRDSTIGLVRPKPRIRPKSLPDSQDLAVKDEPKSWDALFPKYKLLGSAILELGEPYMGKRMEDAKIEPLTGQDLLDRLDEFSQPAGNEQAGWYYLYALVGMKYGAEAERQNDTARAAKLERAFRVAMGNSAKLNHPPAARWWKEYGKSGSY